MAQDSTGLPPDPQYRAPESGAPLGETGRAAAESGEDADLADSLARLGRLAMGEGKQALPDMLTHIAHFAVQAIPGADGAGVTLLEKDRADTIVATADFVKAVDDIQYGLGEGPCISAAKLARTMRSGSVSMDPAWPRFGPRVADLGVHSVLSLPLLAQGNVLGAMNVYAFAPNSFDDRATTLGELFAVPAAISVQNAQALFQARRLAMQLQTALNSRATIDQAIGILMSRAGCTADEAFEKLRVLSQTGNRRLSNVAQHVVDDAVRRARARRAEPRSPG